MLSGMGLLKLGLDIRVNPVCRQSPSEMWAHLLNVADLSRSSFEDWEGRGGRKGPAAGSADRRNRQQRELQVWPGNNLSARPFIVK